MGRKKKRKIVEINIEIDVENKFFKVFDYDYLCNGGGLSGGYYDKEDIIEAFSEYFRKYICVDPIEEDN